MKIQKQVSPHFERFIRYWNNKFMFLVGGYGSGKSYHIALKIILKALEEERTILVVREVYDTLRESCFSLMCEIIADLDLEKYFKTYTSPLKITASNGSKIIFRGLDRADKLKSIHNVSLIWAEECSEMSYAGFKELLGRLRHPSLDLFLILSTNPVSSQNWCYKHFFELRNISDNILYENREMIYEDTYYHHSTADDNRFLPASYIQELDNMRSYDPDLYRVARLGRFGINGTRVLPQFTVMSHEDVMEKVNRCHMHRVGMDFGFVESYNAVVRIAVDDIEKILYIYYEYYDNNKTDDQTALDIDEFRQSQELIYADSAEPKTIAYFRQLGFQMRGARKFPGSRLQNTKKLKRFHKIVCSHMCTNVIRELQELTYKKDRNDSIIEDEFNIDPHTFSAIWYALDGYEVANLKTNGLQRIDVNRLAPIHF